MDKTVAVTQKGVHKKGCEIQFLSESLLNCKQNLIQIKVVNKDELN